MADGGPCFRDEFDEQFYESLESMFDNVLKMLKKLDRKTNDKYFPRLLTLANQVSGIGWGHHDYLITELETAFPEKF